MQKKQCHFFKGLSGPMANIIAKGAISSISSVNTSRPTSDLLGEAGLGRPSLDHLYKLFFSRLTAQICPRVFKLSEPLISVTCVWQKRNAASAFRLDYGCCELSPAERSLPNVSVTVGGE